jgi:predicted aspartyl protease
MGESLSFTAQIAYNGHSFSISALGDTGAGGYIYIDSALAVQAAKAFGLHTLPLPHPIPTEGYDGHLGRLITHALELTLIIDGRLPMLITDLGRHDLILGQIWFKEFRVLPNYRKGRLL